MPRLILLNGPPACGKSTLARRFVEDHPLALDLDVDEIRGLLGRWRDDPHNAGLRAREIALAAARVHLAAGHDVVVPQFLARVTFIEQLETLAGEANASFHEIVLMDGRQNMLRRFAERDRPAIEGSARDLSAMYDRLVSLLATRPDARIIHVQEGKVELAYRALLDSLG